MAYATADLNPLAAGLLESQTQIWIYRNTAGDSEATVKGASYFSDAFDKGLKAGDIVFIFNVGGSLNSSAILQVNATAPTKSAKGATVAATVVIT